LSGKTEWTETPRLPPNPNKTAVDRHKQIIRQEFQKLESARQDYDHEVDFELSDDEEEQLQRQSEAGRGGEGGRDRGRGRYRESLLQERAGLLEELRALEAELVGL
jgi:hypothetical protein